jgi:hypothetical protein
MTLRSSDLVHQGELKAALQAEKSSRTFEVLAAALVGRLVDLSLPLARPGFQHGGDAGAAGQEGRRFRLEAKKYADTTSFSDRELLGEIDHALARDERLEAWILAATRSVPEQLRQDLVQKGERIGVPVIILDWSNSDMAPLAALCASAPELVDLHVSKEAGDNARALQPAAQAVIEALRRDLQVWSLGFESLRTRSHRKLEGIWDSPRTSTAELGQDAAGGAQPKRVRRETVHSALDRWWQGPARGDAPAAVVGWDGVGKTWSALDWLRGRNADQPIVLVVPSSALAPAPAISESGVKEFLAKRLYDLAGVRDPEHWLRRLDLLLKRPPEEGPVATVLFDGLNQEPSAPWLPLLKALQGPAFEGRVRVMVTTRRHYFEERLSELRGLVVPAVLVAVDLYDLVPGGEFDRMLAFEGLVRPDLHQDLVELARTPRLFKLVIRFRTKLVEAGQVTVHRLLWEYGRDTFGHRAGKSFSEADWRAWLADIASRHRQGISEYSLKSLGETASRPDLTEGQVYARLSDIIDGRFAMPGTAGQIHLNPTVVAHALGAALLARLDDGKGASFAEIEAEASEWLDPIAGLDQRAEILRAAVSILVERGASAESPVAGVLVTAWLQSQNVTDGHRRELAMLASSIAVALLDAVEHSDEHSQSSARLWAVNALRAIPRTEGAPLDAIVVRTRRWLSVVSRDVHESADGADLERQRADRYRARIGVDESGALTVLGVELLLVDRDDGRLQAAVPSIIEGFPLAKLLPCFEAAAIAYSICGHAAPLKAFKWLCCLNELDPEATAEALRGLSAELRERRPEPGVHAKLAGRVAVLLLGLTGHEVDEDLADSIDDRLDDRYVYERDYLENPARSLFALERRHADIALLDQECSNQYRLQRTGELWLDPTFRPPDAFIEELSRAASGLDVGKLSQEMGNTQEDWFFEHLEPALARIAPDLLADIVRRKLRSFASRPAAARYSSAIHAANHFILAGHAEAAAASTLRLGAREGEDRRETFAASDLVRLEVAGIDDALAQFDCLIAADLKTVPADFAEVMKNASPDEIDVLIARYGSEPGKRQQDLIVLLSVHPTAFSEFAWGWLTGMIEKSDDRLRGVLFRMLTLADAARFGRALVADGWSWDPKAPLWINHYGSGALIKAETGLPFEQLAPRLAPWRLLEAVRTRGADPLEIALAAEMLDIVLTASKIAEPDPGSSITVDRTERRFVPFIVSVRPRPDPEERADPAASLRAAMDIAARAKAQMRAFDTANERIEAARKLGASLYLTDINAEDMELVVRHRADMVQRWLEGHREITADFKRRVHLAEPAYLALCEALLGHDPARGAGLWRALRASQATRYLGACGIDELLHIPFRVRDSEEVETLRDELLNLPFCRSDRNLFEIATAASYNSKSAWLAARASEDAASPLVWRQRRGVLLAGLGTGNELPESEAWPDGPIRTDHADLRRHAARLRWVEACARHWWLAYLAAKNVEDAYAAWILFMRSADIRAWSWMRTDVAVLNTEDDLLKRKLAHVHLNRSDLKSAMQKRMDKPERKFLDEDIVQGVGPWGTMPHEF